MHSQSPIFRALYKTKTRCQKTLLWHLFCNVIFIERNVRKPVQKSQILLITDQNCQNGSLTKNYPFWTAYYSLLKGDWYCWSVPFPSNQLPCRRDDPEWRYASFCRLAKRRANALLPAEFRWHRPAWSLAFHHSIAESSQFQPRDDQSLTKRVTVPRRTSTSLKRNINFWD